MSSYQYRDLHVKEIPIPGKDSLYIETGLSIPADGLALNGAKPSAGTMMTNDCKVMHVFYVFLLVCLILYSILLIKPLVKNVIATNEACTIEHNLSNLVKWKNPMQIVQMPTDSHPS